MLFRANLDGTSEGLESFKTHVNLNGGVEINVDIDDTLPAWGYALNITPNPAAEGQTVIITLNTVNVPDGTVLSYLLSGTGNFNLNDVDSFSPDRVNSNYVLVDFPPISDNITSAQLTIENDGVVESGEIMLIRAVYRSDVNTTSNFSEFVYLDSNNVSIPVNDTPTSQPIVVYAQGPISNPELRYDYAPEGYNIVFEIPCEDLVTGDMVSWQLSGSGGFDLNDIDHYYLSSSTNDSVLVGNPGNSGTSEVVAVTTQLPGGVPITTKLCKVKIWIKQDSISESGEYATLTSRGISATMEVRDF